MRNTGLHAKKRSETVTLQPKEKAVFQVILVFAINDVIIDVFQFVRRRELDTLQIVSVRFNAIVEKKLALVCLRLLNSAKISRSSTENQFVLIMRVFDAKKKTRLPTGVDDEAAATSLLLHACQSSRVDTLELYGTTPMDVAFFDSLALHAPTIFVKDFSIGEGTLSDSVPHDRVLRALQSFAELKVVKSETIQGTHLPGCLIRTCFKAGVTLRSPVFMLDNECDLAVVEDAMLEFSLGECDEQYATRERHLQVYIRMPLNNDFLQRWIEVSSRN